MFFDNLKVTHIRGPLLEETHYYPFGLTMSGISSKAAGKLENKRKFNDRTEPNNELGLDWYETVYGGYDAQIGRFHQHDPLAEDAYDLTPFAFVNNNPLIFNDPLGLDTVRVGVNNGTTVVDAKNADGTTGSYVVDLNNPNNLVGTGMSGSSEVAVTSSRRGSSANIPWYIDPGMAGLENHLANTLKRYASDGTRGFGSGRPILPGTQQRIYDRMISQNSFLKNRTVNIRLHFGRTVESRNVAQSAMNFY